MELAKFVNTMTGIIVICVERNNQGDAVHAALKLWDDYQALNIICQPVRQKAGLAVFDEV